MVRAVIFDIGGVLAHDIWEHLFLDDTRGIASRYKLDRREAEKVGALLWESFAYVPETRRNSWQELERRYWQHFIGYYREQLPQGISPETFIDMTEDFIKPIEGMERILADLHTQGMSLAICSNNNEFWYKRQMDKCGLHRFFSQSKVVLSCRVGVAKSSSRFEMFHEAADVVALPKAQCLFIDDRHGNVERAKASGMDAILFTDVQTLEKELCTRTFGTSPT